MTATEPIRSGLRNPANAFMAAVGLSMAGSAVGMLGATAATTSGAHGGLATGGFLSVMLLASGLAVPYAPFVTHRLHVRRAYTAAKTLSAAAYTVAGIALLLGAPPAVTLILSAPAFGIAGGLAGNASPVLGKAYLAADHTAHSAARMGVIGGISWSAGALAGGALLSHVAYGWGVLLNGLVTGVLVLTVLRMPPAVEPHAQRAVEHPWRSAIGTLRNSRTVRLAFAEGVVVLVFIAPLVAMTVPVADGLRDESAVRLGSLLMAAIGAGEFLTPLVVRRETQRHSALTGSARVAVIAGLAVIALGLSAIGLSDGIELVAWTVIGFAIGTFRFASRSLSRGAAAEVHAPSHSSANLAAFALCGLAAPFGTMLWAGLIDSGNTGAALIVGGVGGILGSLVVLGRSRSATEGDTP